MPYLIFAAALAFAISPFLSPEFGGFDADRFPVPQDNPPGQPAGYAFGIWGVIYLWLIVGTGFQAFKRREARDWAALRGPLLVSLVVGIAWLPVALSSPIWATVLIWIMWGGAVTALARSPRRDVMFGAAPIGLYAGWLTAASCVSLALLSAGYGLLDETTAALVALVIALVLTSSVMRLRPDVISYPAAVVWALIAVAVANWGGGPPSVLMLAIVGAVLVAALGVLNWVRARND